MTFSIINQEQFEGAGLRLAQALCEHDALRRLAPFLTAGEADALHDLLESVDEYGSAAVIDMEHAAAHDPHDGKTLAVRKDVESDWKIGTVDLD